MTDHTRRNAVATIFGGAAALPAAASAAASPNQRGSLGPADSRLCAIRDRCRAILAFLHTPDSPEGDELREPFFQELDALQFEALTIAPDDARGAAVQARFRFMQTCEDYGNGMGDRGPDSEAPDGNPLDWRIAKALEAKADAVDPTFAVWPDHGANAENLATAARKTAT